jgi:hypothetical protein
VGSFTERGIGSEDGAEVSDHEIVFRTRSHDLAVVITVRRPDEELTFLSDGGAVAGLFVLVGDAESNLVIDGIPERHVSNLVEARKGSGQCTSYTFCEGGEAVLTKVVEHRSGRLTFGASRDAGFSEDCAIRTVNNVGGAVDVGVGEGGLQEVCIFIVKDSVGVGHWDGRGIEFQRFNNSTGEEDVVECGGVVVIRIEDTDDRDGVATASEEDEIVISGIVGVARVTAKIDDFSDSGGISGEGDVSVISSDRFR